MDSTRQTLIERVRDISNERAWEEFYSTYWGVILRYARKLGLSESGAQDVLQETMIALIRTLPTFQYDLSRGRFRNFVLTITHRKTLAAFRRNARSKELSLDDSPSDDGPTALESLPAPVGETVETLDEKRWQDSIYEEALARVRHDPSIQASTFDIFQAYVADGQPAEDVAQRYGINKNAVYQIKNRLMRRIADEVEQLQEV
jgi:RNA polymerase sigma factor (sigma-70 family)